MPEQEKPATTSRGMPIVTAETIRAILGTYTKGGESWGQRLNEEKERFIIEQPELTKFIEAHASKYPSEMLHPVLETVMTIYSVLEQQASSDQLSNSIAVTPKKVK